ncbi:DinB family protein [Reichenbachiella sp. MALMAid0571]|uniref:DinB family protein n=1 Tax=Reichenbachiella sp. MALMAid0571 TaxID=3143939 RepID=UPI0032DE5841
MIEKPEEGEYNEFYQTYIDKVRTKDIIEFLKTQRKSIVRFLNAIPEERYSYKYGEGKWSVKQVLRHMIDTEIVFGYRVHSIAKNKAAELPGMDQNDYMTNSNDSQNTFEMLVEEFNNVRKANISMIENLDPALSKNMGKASGFPISVRAQMYILAGHIEHHKLVLKEKYL